MLGRDYFCFLMGCLYDIIMLFDSLRMLKIGFILWKRVIGMRLEVYSFLNNWGFGIGVGERIISCCEWVWVFFILFFVVLLMF